MGKRFAAVVYKRKKCPHCDAAVDGFDDPGFHERLDCGCFWPEEVGKYESAKLARLVAMAKACKRGQWGKGGRSTGHWDVEADGEGIVETGFIERVAKKKGVK